MIQEFLNLVSIRHELLLDNTLQFTLLIIKVQTASQPLKANSATPISPFSPSADHLNHLKI